MFKLVFGVMSNRKIYPYLILFGWIFPLVITLITIVITRDYYVDRSKHCFLGYEQGVIWAFIAPVLVIIVINVVFLIIAISKIIHNKWGKHDNPHKDTIRDAMVTAMVLTPVLGIPWLILILNVVIRSTILEYLFIILNGLIGLVFLLVVVIRNREVQAILKRKKRVDGSGTTPSGTLSSSATVNSTVASRFKRTGAEKNTLYRVQAKETDIEDVATISNHGFYMKSEFPTEQNIYADPTDTMDKGATPDAQPKPKKERNVLIGTTKSLSGGSKVAKRSSDLEPSEIFPPSYRDVGSMQIVSDVKQNPMYGMSIIGFENSIDDMTSNVHVEEVIMNPIYEEIHEVTLKQEVNN